MEFHMRSFHFFSFFFPASPQCSFRQDTLFYQAVRAESQSGWRRIQEKGGYTAVGGLQGLGSFYYLGSNLRAL